MTQLQFGDVDIQGTLDRAEVPWEQKIPETGAYENDTIKLVVRQINDYGDNYPAVFSVSRDDAVVLLDSLKALLDPNG